MERQIPKDPVMCMSFLNTQLRDHFSSLEELCEEFELEREALCQRLHEAGFDYDRDRNQFR